MESTAESVDQVVEEIMRIHRSLPARPGVDEVEAAKALIRNVEKEDQARLEAIARQTKSSNVSEELFMLLQEMQKNMVYFNSKEQKQEALKLLDLENLHELFDEYIQRASTCVSSPSSSSGSAYTNSIAKAKAKPSDSSTAYVYPSDREVPKAKALVTRDDSYVVSKAKKTFYADGIGPGPAVSSTPQIADSSLKSGLAPGSSGAAGVFLIYYLIYNMYAL